MDEVLIGLRAPLIAAAIALSVATPAAAEVPACHSVQQGDTAARLSLYLTGSVHNAYEPWFQIVDASHTRVVPKSQYNRIQPGWRACVPSSRLDIELNRATPAGLEVFAWWGVAIIGLLGMVLIAHATRQWAIQRKAVVRGMDQFGKRFIREFERPLMLPGCLERPVEARLHVIPAASGWRSCWRPPAAGAIQTWLITEAT